MLSLVKPKTESKKNPELNSRKIVIGDILHGNKEFASFDSLRKDANKALARLREAWLKETLIAHGVKYTTKALTKREIHESLSSNFILISREKTDDTDFDKVYMKDTLIGEWNNQKIISIDFDGRLSITIEYYIK